MNKRLSLISSNQEIFEAACAPYQTALEKSGYSFKLKYDPPTQNGPKNARKRNITYFNPPYSRNVKTNIGKIFLKSIDSCFPKNHVLRKIINRNTVKISYSCMPNFKQKISNHNLKIQKKEKNRQPDKVCNCSGIMGPCPLQGNCLIESVVYKAEVIDSNQNSTRASRTTGAKGSNSFARNNRFWITDDHIERIRCKYLLIISNIKQGTGNK